MDLHVWLTAPCRPWKESVFPFLQDLRNQRTDRFSLCEDLFIHKTEISASAGFSFSAILFFFTLRIRLVLIFSFSRFSFFPLLGICVSVKFSFSLFLFFRIMRICNVHRFFIFSEGAPNPFFWHYQIHSCTIAGAFSDPLLLCSLAENLHHIYTETYTRASVIHMDNYKDTKSNYKPASFHSQ